jgi:hypothetical protein
MTMMSVLQQSNIDVEQLKPLQQLIIIIVIKIKAS